jgi:hypothetical protein
MVLVGGVQNWQPVSRFQVLKAPPPSEKFSSEVIDVSDAALWQGTKSATLVEVCASAQSATNNTVPV